MLECYTLKEKCKAAPALFFRSQHIIKETQSSSGIEKYEVVSFPLLIIMVEIWICLSRAHYLLN